MTERNAFGTEEASDDEVIVIETNVRHLPRNYEEQQARQPEEWHGGN